MKFYDLQDAPVYKDDVVFKKSVVKAAVPTFVMFGLSLAGLLVAFHVVKMDIPIGIGYAVAIGCGLFGLLPLAQFRAALKPTNWLVRASQSGVLIKYRSYLNRKLPATDTQVVGLDYAEIAWARKVIERRVTADSSQGGNSVQATTLMFIELCVKGETAELAGKLSEENAREAGATSHWGDFPVQLMDGGIVRINWRDMTPGIDNALKRLGAYIPIQEAQKSRTDFASAKNLTPEELKEKVRQLNDSGDSIAAVALVKKALHCSTTEAMKFVEKMDSEKQV